MKFSEHFRKQLKEADNLELFKLVDRLVHKNIKAKVNELIEHYTDTPIKIRWGHDIIDEVDSEWTITVAYDENDSTDDLTTSIYFRLSDQETGSPVSLDEGFFMLEGFLQDSDEPVAKGKIDVKKRPKINVGMVGAKHYASNSILGNTEQINDVIKRTFEAAAPRLNLIDDAIIFRQDNNITDSEKLKEEDSCEAYLDKDIDVYNIKDYIQNLSDGEYTTHYVDKAAILTNNSGQGAFVDYEAIGDKFNSLDDKITIGVVPNKEETDEEGHRTFYIMATHNANVPVKDILEKAPKETMKARDFFTKYNYNDRCERNFRELCKYLGSIMNESSLLEAANPENAEANELISTALKNRQFAVDHKKELKDLGIEVDADIYSDGKLGDVYLIGKEGRRLKCNYWDNDDLTPSHNRPSNEIYYKKDNINKYNDETGKYENLKNLDSDFTLSGKSYKNSKEAVKQAKEELPRLKKRLNLYSRRYGEDSREYRELSNTIKQHENTIKKGVQPSYGSAYDDISKDVDFKNYLDSPFRSDRPQERKKYTFDDTYYQGMSRDAVGAEIDPANATSRAYKTTLRNQKSNEQQKLDNLKRDQDEIENITYRMNRYQEDKQRRDSITAKADKEIENSFNDIRRKLADYRNSRKKD